MMKTNTSKTLIRSHATGFRIMVAMGLCTLFFLAVSCGNSSQNKDGVDSAMNVNDRKANDSMLTISKSDADFMVAAANGGMAEVSAGKVAKEKATNSSVKDFGAKMVDDHSKINNRLKALADSLNITLPTTVDKDAQSMIDKLNSTAVKDFDGDYMEMMVKDHNEDVDDFQKASKSISNPGIHNFVMETLPILLEHQQMAKQIDGALK